jgi:N utilization substance protein B
VGLRRQARERAVQALYQLDAWGALGGAEARALERTAVEEMLDAFWQSLEPQEPEVRTLADPLVLGVLDHRSELDELVEACSQNWRLDRMAKVDRNILRLGVFELLHRPDVPAKVAINEAIEIARRYGAEESSAFINGVLDKVAHRAGSEDVE